MSFCFEICVRLKVNADLFEKCSGKFRILFKMQVKEILFFPHDILSRFLLFFHSHSRFNVITSCILLSESKNKISHSAACEKFDFSILKRFTFYVFCVWCRHFFLLLSQFFLYDSNEFSFLSFAPVALFILSSHYLFRELCHSLAHYNNIV